MLAGWATWTQLPNTHRPAQPNLSSTFPFGGVEGDFGTPIRPRKSFRDDGGGVTEPERTSLLPRLDSP